MAAQRPSPFVSIARASLTVAVAFGLASVFAGSRWIVAAFVAAVAPHVIVALAERRRIGTIATFATVLIGAVVFTLFVVEANTLSGGIPTATTLNDYRHHLADTPEILRTAVVPVPPHSSALLLALLALWVAGAAAEWSARRLDATLGAIGPSLVLFVALAALGDDNWVLATIVYALAGTLYLLALHQQEAAERRSWFHGTVSHRSIVLPAGALCALTVVFAAALVAPLTPGARSEAWFDYRSLGDGDGDTLLKAPTPIVSIRSKLLTNPEDEVFTVKLDGPQRPYFRVIALDRYDGELWTLEDSGRPARSLAGATEPPQRQTLYQEYNIVGVDAHWLPAAYHPEEISLKDALVVPESSTLYIKPDSPIENLTYSVTSAIPVASETERDASPPVDPDEFERYLDLPDDLPDEIRTLAADITEDASTPHQQARALALYLGETGGFTYNERVEVSHSIRTLEQFLFETKEGYCEQFAAAFAAMARSLGLPTRVAVGYRQGEVDGNGVYHVKNKNAHAWPEVYFDGLGWLPFEPTPKLGVAGQGTPPNGAGTDTTPPVAGETTTTIAGSTPTGPPVTRPQALPGENGAVAAGAESEEGPSALRQIAVTGGVLVGLALFALVAGVVTLAALALRKTRRRRHAAEARDRVLGAWAEALDRLADAGIEPRPAATSTEFALRHAPAQGAGAAGAPLIELAQLQTAALFAADPPSDEDAQHAWTHVDAIGSAVAHTLPFVTRWRRRLDPRRVREPAEI